MSNYAVTNDGLPLNFMFDGIMYSKEMDGYYHQFHANRTRVPEHSLGTISIADAREIFKTAKFTSSVIFLTNNVNIKV